MKNRRVRMEDYLAVMIQERLWSSPGNLRFYLQYLFGDISFEDKRVLDIGGGSGVFSFYAASMGAREVICLEPLGEGSTSNALARFERARSRLPLASVRLEPVPLQQFDASRSSFDIILLHNSINHLDESACANLHQDEQARSVYRALFHQIGALSAEGAKLIICDCSRHNVFPRLGLRNPFLPSVEWKKHQPPEVWSQLAAEVGFRNPRITWSSFNGLRRPGRLLFGNKVASYFLLSHFCLKMEKANAE